MISLNRPKIFRLLNFFFIVAVISVGTAGCSLSGISLSASSQPTDITTGNASQTLNSAPTAKHLFSGEVRLANGAIAVDGVNDPVILISNQDASDPTYDQLINFLNQDGTDALPYTTSFVCANFADMLYNNAESDGIRAAYVVLDGINHALNAFQTTDKGLIYIDFTGNDPSIVQPIASYGETDFGTSKNYKKVAYIEVGKPLGLISLDVVSNYGFQYSGYEQWTTDMRAFNSILDSYNSRVQADNANGGVIRGSVEYLQMQQLKRQLITLSTKLGTFWEPVGTVIKIELFWKSNHQ